MFSAKVEIKESLIQGNESFHFKHRFILQIPNISGDFCHEIANRKSFHKRTVVQSLFCASTKLYCMKPLFRGNSLTLTGCFQWMVAFLPCCCLLPGLPVPSVVENYFQMQYEGHTQTIIIFFFANMLLILWMFSSK